MEKVIVLNSGGFDSTVLIHYVKDYYPSAEIHSLHFSYGQRSSDEELKWSEYNAEKVGAVIKNITLPPFDWTKSNFYNDGYDYESQYLEWRNLVFLSYALSYAESIGADKIFCAFLKSRGYNDTSEKFLHEINLIGNNIKVIAPFSNIETKEDLIPMAFAFKISPFTFHSCDISNSTEGCGICNDCQSLKVINQELKLDTPIKIYRHCGTAGNEEFNKLCVENTTAWELRVLWNDSCQLKCTHCFYGKTSMKGKRLTESEFIDAVKQAFDLGIPSIHIGGKEPLFDDSIIGFIKEVNILRKNYSHISHPLLENKGTFLSLVTNGINVPKFAKDLKLAGLDKIFISVDDIIGKESSFVRLTSNEIAYNAITSAITSELDVEVFIDIHHKNYNKLPEIIKELEIRGVKNFYLTMLRTVGNGKNIPRLNIFEVIKVLEDMSHYIPIHSNTSITLGFGIYYTNLIFSQSRKYAEILNDILYLGYNNLSKWFLIVPEFFCSQYLSQITLSPDGYILGCATDVYCSDYDKISAGNIKEYSLNAILDKGKRFNLKFNNFEMNPHCFEGCPHEFGI